MRWVWALVVSLWAVSAKADITAAILELSGSETDAPLRRSLVDALAASLGEQPGVRVMTRNELEGMLGFEKLKDAMGCSEVSCLAEIGGALGADRLLTGSLVRRVEQGREFFSLSLQWLDARGSVVLARQAVTWEDSAEGLYQLMPPLTVKLLNPADAESYRGQLMVTAPVTEAAVLVNGAEVGRTPMLMPVSLPIGKVVIDVIADDHVPFRSLAVINRDKTTGFVANLIQKPAAAFYTRWWFWTAAAAVVGGGATAAILGTRGDRSPGGTGDSDDQGSGDPTRASGTFTIPAPDNLGLRLRGGR